MNNMKKYSEAKAAYGLAVDSLDKLEAQVNEAEEALALAAAPFDEQIQKLREQRDAATATLADVAKDLRSRRSKASTEKHERFITMRRAAAEHGPVPDVNMLSKSNEKLHDAGWWDTIDGLGSLMKKMGCARSMYISPRDGLKLTERKDGWSILRVGGTDEYMLLAWHTDIPEGGLQAAMWVDPSSHPGDETDAYCIVRETDGTWEEVSLLVKYDSANKWSRDIIRPQAQFKEVLARIDRTGSGLPPEVVKVVCRCANTDESVRGVEYEVPYQRIDQSLDMGYVRYHDKTRGPNMVRHRLTEKVSNGDFITAHRCRKYAIIEP